MTFLRPLRLTMVAGFAAGSLLGPRAGLADTNDAAVMTNAKITLPQAIAAAENQTGGRAIGTGIEDQDGTIYLEVQVVKGNERQKVLVDPQSGQVVKTVKDDNEQNEKGHEHEDD
jgi:hypothetical protein